MNVLLSTAWSAPTYPHPDCIVHGIGQHVGPVRGELHPGDGVGVARHLRQHRVLPRVPDLEIIVNPGRDHLAGVIIELNCGHLEDIYFETENSTL